MSRQPRDKAWEHSRYKDWRPGTEEAPPRKRGRRAPEEEEAPPRRRSVAGRLLRGLLWLVVIAAVLLPAADWLNGRARAAPGGCRVALVVDAGALVADCPGGAAAPGAIAGYRAPRLFTPGCAAEVPAALMASFELRKALYGAERIELRQAGAGGLQVRGDGADVAGPMLASGRVQPVDGPGWCR
jgi:hypothetical protein